MDVVIVTGDRDSYQLVDDPHIKVLYNKRGVSDYALYDEAGIAERCLGVTPAQYLDYASLRGDTSDNLPGVPGIGEKTAAKLITTYGGLEGIYEHLDELPPKQRTNLAEAKDRVFKNREMSRLNREVDLDGSTPPICSRARSTASVCACCSTSSSSGCCCRASSTRSATSPRPPTPTRSRSRSSIARDAKAAAAALRAPRRRASGSRSRRGWAGVVGRRRDHRSRDLDRRRRHLHRRRSPRRPDGARRARARSTGRDEPAARRAPRQGADARPRGASCASLDRDTAVMAYLLDPGEGKYLLEDLALRYLSLELTSPDQVEGTLDFDGEANVARPAAASRCSCGSPTRSAEALEARELVDALRAHRTTARSACSPRWKTAGVRIDVGFLEELGKELGDECRRLEAEIHAHAGEQFNVNSTPQLRRILFDQLGLIAGQEDEDRRVDRRRLAAEAGGGAPDRRDAAALPRGREAAEHLRRRAAAARQADGRIHATFNQLATTTGRISSEAPNLQNVPVRTSAGRELRKAFIADEGCGLLTADYSQIELRVLAHLADDPGSSRRSSAAPTCTPPPRPRCSTSTRTRSTSSSAASPRS